MWLYHTVIRFCRERHWAAQTVHIFPDISWYKTCSKKSDDDELLHCKDRKRYSRSDTASNTTSPRPHRGHEPRTQKRFYGAMIHPDEIFPVHTCILGSRVTCAAHSVNFFRQLWKTVVTVAIHIHSSGNPGDEDDDHKRNCQAGDRDLKIWNIIQTTVSAAAELVKCPTSGGIL